MRPAYTSSTGQESSLKILAQETETSTEEVVRVYKDELASLEASARVQAFVPALALQKARAKLHKRRHRM